jgi:NADPH-dependent 2,4-dienoyl-CoA reductase/sulfur reductase-like enzyme
VSGDVDVAIVGGGPAGLAAAIELRRRGVARVLVLDREPALGGIPRDCDHLGFGWSDLRRVLSGPAYARRLARMARDAGVDTWTESSATRWSGERGVHVTTPRGVFDVSATAVLLATGCRERPRAARLVPGDRPAGVLTTGALQRLVHLTGQPAGRRAVVVGAEHVSFSAVHTLRTTGTQVAAVVTDLPRHQTWPALRWLAGGLHRVPVLARSEVTRIAGRRRVEGVEVSPRPGGAAQFVPCDTVVFTGDWIPDHELARAGGLALDAATRGPLVDAAFRTSAPGVFAAGNLLHGAEAADRAALEGRAGAAAIAGFLARPDAGWRAEPVLPVQVVPPLKWIVPGLLAGGAPRVFVARVSEFVGPGALEVRQGGHLLHRARFLSLVPNRSLRLDGRWADGVRPDGGPVVVSAEVRRKQGVSA